MTNNEIYSVECSNPQMIVNRRVLSMLSRSSCTINFEGREILGQRTLYKLIYKYKEMPDPAARMEFKTRLFSVYAVDRTGHKHRVFMEVPCGKCALCNEKKRSTWSFRVQAECQAYEQMPFMTTLTYNQAHLPKEGVNHEDFNVFIRRLRDNLRNTYQYTDPVRYFYCGEYGTKHGRPHYHALLWGMPDFSWYKENVEEVSFYEYYTRMQDLINSAWCKRKVGRYAEEEEIGYTYTKLVDNTYGAIRYCTKYMTKRSKAQSEDMNETFCSSSRGNGGIGSRWIKNNVTVENGIDFYFHDKFTNQTFQRLVNRYVKEKVNGTVNDIYGRDFVHMFKQTMVLCELTQMYDKHEVAETYDPLGIIGTYVSPDSQIYMYLSKLSQEEQESKLNYLISIMFNKKQDDDMIEQLVCSYFDLMEEYKAKYEKRFAGQQGNLLEDMQRKEQDIVAREISHEDLEIF